MSRNTGQRAKTRGVGYSGPDSTRPTQPQEGGAVAFMDTASKWSAPGTAQWSASGVDEVGDKDAAAALAQGHPKSKAVPLLKDRANVIGGFGSVKRGG